MNKIVRTLTMAGLGLLAGASLGAPALAADSTTKSAGKASGAQVQQGGREYVAGFYRTLGQCKRTGAIGEWAGKWDDARCYPVRVGFRRGMWMLKVEREWRGGHWGGRDRGHAHLGNFRGHDRDFRGIGGIRGGHDRWDFRGGNDRNHHGGNDRGDYRGGKR